MYMPYPFQIVQSANKIHMAFAFTTRPARSISTGRGPPDVTYMGHSVGRWEGDTLVVDVTEFNGKNWFDRAGNYHSEALHLTERFTPIPDAIHYEVTIEDPKVFTRPWKISMPLYRRLGAEHAAHRVPLHRVRRRVHVRRSAQAAAREALGRRDDDRRHHAQGAGRREAVRVVPTVTNRRAANDAAGG